MHRKSRRWATPIAVLAILAMVVGATFASASVVRSNAERAKKGKVKGCVDAQTRAVRIIPTGKSCKKGENAVVWNKKGEGRTRGPRA